MYREISRILLFNNYYFFLSKINCLVFNNNLVNRNNVPVQSAIFLCPNGVWELWSVWKWGGISNFKKRDTKKYLNERERKLERAKWCCHLLTILNSLVFHSQRVLCLNFYFFKHRIYLFLFLSSARVPR